MTGVSGTTSVPGINFHNLNYVFYANIFNNDITHSLVFIVSLDSIGAVPIILWLLYPLEKNPQYPLDKRLCSPWGWSA